MAHSINYVKEAVAFYHWRLGLPRPLSPQAECLWHYLFNANNAQAIDIPTGDFDAKGNPISHWYWPVWFQVDNKAIARIIGTKSTRRLCELRRKLISEGRIEYQSERPAEQGRYRLIPFDTGLTTTWLHSDRATGGAKIWIQSEPATEQGSESLPIIINNINTKNIKEPSIPYHTPSPAAGANRGPSPPAWETMPFEERCKDFDYVKTLTGEERRIGMRILCNAPCPSNHPIEPRKETHEP